MIEITGMLISMFAVIKLTSGFALILLIIGTGICSGIFGVISTLVWPKYYGLKNLGAISGLAMGFTVAGSAIGPYFFSLSLKYAGTYGIAAFILLVICIILLFFSFKADKPV